MAGTDRAAGPQSHFWQLWSATLPQNHAGLCPRVRLPPRDPRRRPGKPHPRTTLFPIISARPTKPKILTLQVFFPPQNANRWMSWPNVTAGASGQSRFLTCVCGALRAAGCGAPWRCLPGTPLGKRAIPISIMSGKTDPGMACLQGCFTVTDTYSCGLPRLPLHPPTPHGSALGLCYSVLPSSILSVGAR